jgi:hypothetical protein
MGGYLLKLGKIVWAGPYSLLGLVVGVLGVLTGGKCRFSDGALEFYGGATRLLVRCLPTGRGTIGFTLGHVVLGQDSDGLTLASKHERVHVRQYERWGPFLGPAYLLASVWIWSRGGSAYRDNPFEVEAYREAP